MARAAIIESAITQFVAEGRELYTASKAADEAVVITEQKLNGAREIAKARRIELGMLLRKVRSQMPARGTKTDGWQAFLEAIEMPETTAARYMQEAGGPVTDRTNPQSSQVGVSELPDVPPPRDEDAPREADTQATDVDELDIDRDTWCTPKWITDAIGEFDLDPCANDRSHVQAKKYFELEARGEDGLVLASSVRKTSRVFINPPYSDVMPWVQAYRHTRFCFLLKVDPSTKWFEALLEATELVLIPRRTRVQFEAPVGVPPEKAIANQFPHALFYARATDATDAIAALCYPGWFINKSA